MRTLHKPNAMQVCMSARKAIPVSIRRVLLQRPQCANVPGNHAPGCKGYTCPMWKSNNGFFDESGKQIDHIIEVKHDGTNDLHNLQALCPCCHAVKTKRCARHAWEFNSVQIDYGCARMEISRPMKRTPH